MEAYSVSPGECRGVDFLGKEPKIVIFCEVDNEKGSVLINGPKRALKILKYKNCDSTIGKRVKPNSKIEILGSEGLKIYKKKRFEKEVVVFLSSGQNQEPNPQENPDQDSFDSPPLSAA